MIAVAVATSRAVRHPEMVSINPVQTCRSNPLTDLQNANDLAHPSANAVTRDGANDHRLEEAAVDPHKNTTANLTETETDLATLAIAALPTLPIHLAPEVAAHLADRQTVAPTA